MRAGLKGRGKRPGKGEIDDRDAVGLARDRVRDPLLFSMREFGRGEV